VEQQLVSFMSCARGLLHFAENSFALASGEALSLLVGGDRERYEAHGWGGSPKVILTCALKAGGESAAEARQLIERLMGRGHHSYRALLS
jgi:hypothetical protein